METENLVAEECKESAFHHDDYFKDKNDSPLRIEHKWEGKVDKIEGETIIASMYNSVEDAWDELKFEKSEISNSDLDLIKKGALVNFYIGSRMINGTVRREKKIKFRRIYLGNKIDQILDSFNKNSFSDLFEEY